jgi:hypothetical protein
MALRRAAVQQSRKWRRGVHRPARSVREYLADLGARACSFDDREEPSAWSPHWRVTDWPISSLRGSMLPFREAARFRRCIRLSIFMSSPAALLTWGVKNSISAPPRFPSVSIPPNDPSSMSFGCATGKGRTSPGKRCGAGYVVKAVNPQERRLDGECEQSLKYFHNQSRAGAAAAATTTHRCSQWRNFGACAASLKFARR